MPNLVINNDVLFSQVVSLLREGHEVSIPVKGGSMLPLIREGRDSVSLVSVSSETILRRGDIVLFKWRGSYILHRVLSFRDGVAEIQGDGNVCGTEHPHIEDIFGRVISISRKGRSIDPNSPLHLLEFRIWLFLRPLRRYLLFIHRHTFYKIG